MPLFLEVKKFVNSEHTGNYVEIQIPGALVMPEAPEAERPAAAKAPGKKSPKSTLMRFLRLDEDDTDEDEIDEADAESVSEVRFAAEPTAEDDGAADDAEPLPDEEITDEPEAAEEIPPVEPIQEYETVRLHYMDEGDGEPLILVHTIGQSLYTWRNIYGELSRHYRVIVLDLPGHGYSSRPAYCLYTIEEMGTILEKFMDALQIESAHFLGFSMSYAYVMEFARKHPERVGKLVLMAPGGLVPEMPLAIRMIDSSIFGAIACRLYGLRTVENILSDCFFDLTNINQDVVAAYYKTASDIEARKAIRNSLHNYDDEAINASLRSLDVPVLILWGNEDKWRKSEASELLHAALPNSSVSVIRNAGHLMHEEKAEKVIAAILEYIPAPLQDIET